MNYKILYVYAITKTIYENLGDYLDTLYAFVLKVLPDNKTFVDKNLIQKSIQDTFGLFIPEFSLKSIITRAKNKGYLKETNGRIALLKEGDRYIQRLEPEGTVNRRVNELLDNIRIYLNDPSLTIEQVYKIVVCFINENIDPILDFFDPSGRCNLKSRVEIKKYESRLVEYFNEVNKKSPNLYKTLQDIVYGSVITLSGTYENIADINMKFKDVEVFLDSNVVLSLFEFHLPEVVKPVLELFKMLKEHKFKLNIFDFTINEVVHVLSNYPNEESMYYPGLKVNSIYSSLKNKGWTIYDVREFIQKIEEKIWALGISIYPTKIDLDTYSPPKHYIDKIKKYKPLIQSQPEQVYNHDLLAIERIKAIRGKAQREIEKSVAFFLTSDLKLSKFDYIELNHKQDLTVCEVIPDRLLTNILWLKNPSFMKEVPIQSIIAIHSQGIFIDQKIWKRFYHISKKLKEENKIEEIDMAMLFYRGHIEEVLCQIDETQIETVNSEFVLAEIVKVREKIDDETKRKLEAQESNFVSKIEEEVKKQKDWQAKLEEIKTKLKDDSCKEAICITNFEVVVLFLLLIVTVTQFPRNIMFKMLPIITILGFFEIKVDFWRIRSKSITEKFNSIYKKKLGHFSL